MRTLSVIGIALLGLVGLAQAVEVPSAEGRRPSAEQFASVFGLPAEREGQRWSSDGAVSVQLIASSAPATILWPGEKARFTLKLANAGAAPLPVKARLLAIPYGLRCGAAGDIWALALVAGQGEPTASKPFAVDIPAGGFLDREIDLPVGERFGGYGLVLEVEGRGRFLAGSCVRVMKPEASAKRPFYRLTMDLDHVPSLLRLGAAPNRIQVGYMPSDRPGFEEWYARAMAPLRVLAKARREDRPPIMKQRGNLHGRYLVVTSPAGCGKPGDGNSSVPGIENSGPTARGAARTS